MFGMMSTYAPEQRDELISSPEKEVIFLRARLHNMRMNLAKECPELDFTWLEEMEEKINSQNVCPITAFAAVHVPDKTLLQQGVILIGDAFVTTPFMFGSEYNEHVHQAWPNVLAYLKSLSLARDPGEVNAAIDHFVETLWKFILNERGVGRLLKSSDFVGNTVMSDGSRVNISPKIGFPLSRELLEELNQDSKSWITTPEHQQGGRLELLGQKSHAPLPLKQNKPLSHISFSKIGLFAAAAVGTVVAANLVRLVIG